jgi:hypothetical protein
MLSRHLRLDFIEHGIADPIPVANRVRHAIAIVNGQAGGLSRP